MNSLRFISNRCVAEAGLVACNLTKHLEKRDNRCLVHGKAPPLSCKFYGEIFMETHTEQHRCCLRSKLRLNFLEVPTYCAVCEIFSMNFTMSRRGIWGLALERNAVFFQRGVVQFVNRPVLALIDTPCTSSGVSRTNPEMCNRFAETEVCSN